MTAEPITIDSRWRETAQSWFYRIAASGALPARCFERRLPTVEHRGARTGHLALEIVSHCWKYSHLLVYQLSSLVNFPPSDLDVTMTVFYCPEDEGTAELLSFFQRIDVPGVRWNWQSLPRERLFRRAIGRNQAALSTTADWVWFTDCDLLFRDDCLDTLAERLQGRRDALVYPREERRTLLLTEHDLMITAGRQTPQILDVDTSQFSARHPTRATGPLQITHGDVCRSCGYCDAIRFYQRPADHWRKAREDRAFRWLLQTPGVPLDIPSVYRIRHAYKGRYAGGDKASTRLRTAIRRLQARLRGHV